MNTLVIVLIAALCLFGAYTLYGRWLANKWGIDPTAKTPAVVHEDGRDYVPTNGRPPVQLHRRCRPCHRCHPGCCFRLAAGPAVGAAGRHLLRRCHRLRRSVRFRQERRQEHGHAHREVHRQDRPQAVPAVLLAVLRHRHRGVCGHGGRYLQRLRRRRRSGGGCPDQRRCRHGLHHVHGLCCRLRPHPEEVQLLRLERERHQHRVHRAVLRHRREPAPHSGQGRMELHHLRLHLLCRCSAHVAAEAAP